MKNKDKNDKKVYYQWCALTLKPENCAGQVTWKCRRGKQSEPKEIFYEKFNDRFRYLKKHVFTTGPNKGKDARCKKGLAPSHLSEKATSVPKQKAEEMQLCIGYSCNFYRTTLKLRLNPVSFVPALEKQMSFFKGKTLNDPSVIDPFAYSRGNDGDGIMTYEGKKAWESAITSLKQQGQVGSVLWSDGLSLVAGDVCANAAKVRGDGKTVWQRAERYGLVKKPQESVSQYGAPEAERSVLDLYIDDGLNPRFNRLALINEGVSMMGVANCRHTLTNARIVVGVFADGFTLNDYGKKRVKVAQQLLKQEKIIATAT